MKKPRAFAAPVVALTLTLEAGAAAAQSEPAKSESALDEVVVTATRRESTIREVPFSIAALDGESLRTQQINNPQSLVATIPGITIDTTDKSLSIVAIRGNTSTFRTATLDTPVAFFVDDVYYVFTNDLNANFYDLTRVEVLRGPQGTLFGRNVVGGAIAVVTNNPSFDPDYFAEATGGNGGYVRTEGMVNGALVGDKLAGRFAFSTERSDGLIDTPRQEGNLGEFDNQSARGKLLFRPADSLSIVLSGDYSKSSGNGGAITVAAGGPQVIPATFGPFANEKWANNSPIRNPYHQSLRGGYLRGDLDLFGGALTSISGYRLNDSDSLTDDVPVAAAGAVFGRSQRVGNRSFTQELRFASAPGGLSYVVGAYYLSADVSTFNGFAYSPLAGSPVGGAIPPNPGMTNINRFQNGDVTSIAGFGEATFAITDRWSLIAGARYTQDKKAIDYRAESETNGNTRIAVFGFPGTVVASGEESWDAVTPRFSIQYRPVDDVNLYATYAKGFKSGGFVDNAYANPTLPLNPEDAKNYEVGLKSRLFDARATFNISVFQQETKNLQNFSGAGGIAHTYNGTAKTKGVEVESAAQLTDAFRLSLNYAYVDGEYTDLRDPLVNVNYSGNPVKYTPKNSFTLAGNYDYYMSSGRVLTLQSDFAYATEVHTDDANLLQQFPNLYEDTAGRTLNARIVYKSADERWSVGLWGKNLTDHYQISVADDITSFLAVPGATRYWKIFSNQPRTYGVTLSFRH